MPHVKLFGGLRRHVKEYELDIPGQSIDEVLQTLCTENTALCDAIFDGDNLRAHVRVMVSGRDVELDEGLHTTVGEADEIAIFPPIAGGSGTAAESNIRP
jgi:molybdopterin synthase sulfur carrier subunit